MKNINISRVLRTIWQKKGISRIEIAKELGLDKSTVTNIISALIKQGLVEEVAEGESSPQGGRKPIFLNVNKEYGCLAGFEFQPNYYEMVLVNLNGDILASRHTEQEISLSSENLIARLSDIINEINLLVKEKGLNLLGIGIGFSGIIYPLEGIIYKSIPLQIDKPLDILSPLQEKADVPVYIENDANCCAWGELAFHKTSQLKNFVFVLLEIREQEVVRKNYGGIAVGLGIVMDGKVYYGHNYSSGEFRSVFAKRSNLSQFSLSKEELLKINENEDIFIRFADELSKNLALLISALNVSHVFFSSFNVKFKNDIIPILKENLNTLLPYPSLAQCEVRFSSMEELTVAYGAAGMLLERLFAHPVIPQAGQEANHDAIKIF